MILGSGWGQRNTHTDAHSHGNTHTYARTHTLDYVLMQENNSGNTCRLTDPTLDWDMQKEAGTHNEELGLNVNSLRDKWSGTVYTHTMQPSPLSLHSQD